MAINDELIQLAETANDQAEIVQKLIGLVKEGFEYFERHDADLRLRVAELERRAEQARDTIRRDADVEGIAMEENRAVVRSDPEDLDAQRPAE